MRPLLVTGVFPPDIGGPATYIPALAHALTERGHAVRVLTASDPEHMDRADAYPFEVLRVSRGGAPWQRFWTYARAIRAAARDADLIFANGLPLEVGLANRSLQRPLVLKVVGDEAWERAQRRGWTDLGFDDFQAQWAGLRGELFKALRSWGARQVDRVVTPSHYLANQVAGWGVPRGRIHVIENAVVGGEDTRPARLPLDTSLRAVVVGRLVRWKHVDEVIETAARLPDVGLAVVGDGPERPALEALTRRRELSGRVWFAGQRSGAEARSLLAGADVLVLNSSYEGLPHVVLEAMTLGVPVVATAAGGTPEALAHGGGILVPVHDPAALGAALARLTADPELRRRLGREGQAAIREHFTWARMVDRTVSLMEGSR